MDPAHTVAYGADQAYGIVKFTNNAGTWVPAPYYFSSHEHRLRHQPVGQPSGMPRRLLWHLC